MTEIEEPALRPDYVKVKVVAVALNPTDVHHTASAGRVGGIVGCDISGIVEEVGKECKSDVKKGDAVWAVSHGANLSDEADGGFAEFAQVRDGHIAKIPEGMSFEETCALGVGITSTGQTLYMTLKLPFPGDKPLEDSPFIFIYGGSTATGTMAIQFAKLSGLKVVSTASPANFDLVKSRGADAVFDYHDPDCARKIKDYTNGSLHYVLDCISTEQSFKIVAEALPESSDKPIQVVTLLPTDTWPRKDVQPTTVLAYTSLGKAFTKFGMDLPAIPPHFDSGVKFWKLSNELLAAGKIKPHPVALRSGGLSGIPDGLAEHGRGEVSGVKLVYKLSDTDDSVTGSGSTVEAPKLGSNW
ncbi:oxidoreductase-like protein [Massariosphaeria phaeospora]|uniref:Oxidoreductase-like protein n=1 Tax=Massariosphaeria phaeospora TaxID=100035 RepID=A0A7C8M6Q9_9PLEO|nr:oxidoreductase-like protein [Massariosphaeria phaeospora]